MPDATRQCATCLWWDKVPRVPQVGKCRRRSPGPEERTDGNCVLAYARWPLTIHDDWCGDYQPPAVAQQRG